MASKHLYCEETNLYIYHNDILTISSYPNVKFIAKNGWYELNSSKKKGWYFVSILDKSIIPADDIDLTLVEKSDSHFAVSTDNIDNEEDYQEEVSSGFLYLEKTDTKINPNDTVRIIPNTEKQYIAKFGVYKLDNIKKSGWYFLSVEDNSIIPLSAVNLDSIIKDDTQAPSILPDMDSIPSEVKYLTIPNTNIRLYDGDIIKISNKPQVKWITHYGWFIYDKVQNYGWYFVSIADGEILPATVIDLTLCTLVTTKTQGSESYDGKVVYYTRPYTEADAEVLRRTFITVDTITQRDNIESKSLVNGRIVRVNNVGGVAVYYAWNSSEKSWEKVDFGGSSTGGIPEVEGTSDNPIILSELVDGLYRVIGTYKVSPKSKALTAPIDYLAFVASKSNGTHIKTITDSGEEDFIVKGNNITFDDKYATQGYVDEEITKVLTEDVKPIPKSFIDTLFA